MLFCCIALQYIDVSRLYHFVRGQNIVKLYLIYNLMEVIIFLFLFIFIFIYFYFYLFFTL